VRPAYGKGFEITKKKYSPIHPCEILLEEFLVPMNLSQYRLAKDIGVAARQINEIVHGSRAITADTALRLARYFGTSERFWMNLQARYDLEVAKIRLGRRLRTEVVTTIELSLTLPPPPGIDAAGGKLIFATEEAASGAGDQRLTGRH
jgi:addiction module HigA family antidote